MASPEEQLLNVAPDGSAVVICKSDSISLFNIKNLNEVTIIKPEPTTEDLGGGMVMSMTPTVYGFVWSKDGKTISYYFGRHGIAHYDVQSGTTQQVMDDFSCGGITWSPAELRMALSDGDALWVTQDSKGLKKRKNLRSTQPTAGSHDGKSLLFAQNNTLFVKALLEKGKKLVPSSNPNDKQTSLAAKFFSFSEREINRV